MTDGWTDAGFNNFLIQFHHEEGFTEGYILEHMLIDIEVYYMYKCNN